MTKTKLISRRQKPPQVRYAEGGAKMHMVHDGETLQDIADLYGTQHIFDDNGRLVDDVQPGQRLWIQEDPFITNIVDGQYYIQQDNTQLPAKPMETHQYNTTPRKNGRTWEWYDEEGNRHWEPIQEEVSQDSRLDWQREHDRQQGEMAYQQYQQQKAEEDAAAAAGGLLTMAFPSTYVGPLFNNNGLSYTENLLSGEGTGSVAENLLMDFGAPAFLKGAPAVFRGLKRFSDSTRARYLLGKEIKKAERSWTPTRQAWKSVNPNPQYISGSQYLPNNLEQLQTEFESLLNPTTHVVYVDDILGKYPSFDQFFYRQTPENQAIIRKIPITTKDKLIDAVEGQLGRNLSLKEQFNLISGPGNAFIRHDTNPIVVITPRALVDAFMRNPDTPLDLGQALLHEFSNAITVNNPAYKPLLKYSLNTNALSKGITFEEFKNSPLIRELAQKWFDKYVASLERDKYFMPPSEYELRMSPEGLKKAFEYGLENEAQDSWKYFFRDAETDQLARLSQLKTFAGDGSPYYLKNTQEIGIRANLKRQMI